MKKELLAKVVDDLKSLVVHLEEALKEDVCSKQISIEKCHDEEVSLEDVRKVLAGISQYGLTKEVKKLIQKYGGDKLSDVSPSKYKELLEDAKEIKIE